LENCRLVELGSGLHYLQEDHPETIGRSAAEWIAAIEGARPGPAAERPATPRLRT